jgi:DNA N-6-adenine-methyltransferase (Dam)
MFILTIKGDHLYFRGMLNAEERRLSSGHRELLAITKTLQYYGSRGATNNMATNIYWLTDSQNMATFLTKGSGKSHIQKEVFRVMMLCKSLNLRIIPIHLLRDDPRIKIADDGSETTDTDDWQVDDETFQRIHLKYKFTLDFFASNRNRKCHRFFSNFYCPETFGIDAFCHSWDEETAWMCPPKREVTRIVRKLRKSKITGVLFVPEWKTADFWVEIFDDE